MAEVVVVGWFTAHPGQEDEALSVMEALIEPTHGEEGCVLYALHRGSDDPRRIAFLERWATRETHNAHMASPHVQGALARVDELFESGEVVVFDPVPGGAPRKGSLADHAEG